MKPKTILLVDDEEVILSSLSYDLSNRGLIISVANNGEAAIAKLQNHRFNAVVSDLSMEEMSGIEVLKQAKELDPEIAVIILTGYGDMNSAIEALRLGADDYLLKPCDTEELYMRIEKCLDKQEALRKVKLYETILPICCVCGDIRDDSGKEPGKGEWMSSAQYIIEKTSAEVTHSYCPKCYKKAMQEF